jgi:hypothetical protein
MHRTRSAIIRSRTAISSTACCVGSPNCAASGAWPAAKRNKGVGTELFSRTVLAARNRGISKLFVNFLSQNARMQAIAKKFDAVVTYDSDGGHAQIDAPRANALSVWKEAVTDGQDLADSMMQMHTRALRSA